MSRDRRWRKRVLGALRCSTFAIAYFALTWRSSHLAAGMAIFTVSAILMAGYAMWQESEKNAIPGVGRLVAANLLLLPAILIVAIGLGLDVVYLMWSIPCGTVAGISLIHGAS